MKFLVVGLGSMGKRRIRNLLHHNIKSKNIFGFDLSPERRQEAEEKFEINTFAKFDTAISEANPDAFIISTPPHLHAEYFLYAAKHKKHFFVEVATTNDGYKKLYPLLNDEFIAAPSVTFRYYHAVQKIKKIVESKEIGKILAFNHHLGQYLPDWHPWEDYRKFYASHKASSACKEMVPYELQWLQFILDDEFVKTKGMTNKQSDLDMNIDDTYMAILESKKGILGTMIVELIARPAVRFLRLLGSEGTLEWDWQRYEIRVWSTKNNKWRKIKLPKGKKIAGYKTTTEEMYEAELGDFLSAIKGKKKYPYTFAEDAKNFEILEQIER